MLQLSKSKAGFRTAAFTTPGGSLIACEASRSYSPEDGPVCLQLLGVTAATQEQIGELIEVLGYFQQHGRLPVPPPPVRGPYHSFTDVFAARGVPTVR